MERPTEDKASSPLVFPALQVAAEQASADAQKAHLRFFYFNAGLLLVGSGFATILAAVPFSGIFGAAAFLGSLACYLSGHLSRNRRSWYQARALAESIKTATWRLVMGADPYSADSPQQNQAEFREVLRELLRDNSSLGILLSGDVSGREQVTASIKQIQGENFSAKRELYLNHRIKDQRNWYSKKAAYNRRWSRYSCWFISALYALLVILMLVRIKQPEGWYPIALLSVTASSVIAWTQVKRFDELASAYSLTAQEVGIIEDGFADVNSKEKLADFVADAENAFSREHTQWAARRDH